MVALICSCLLMINKQHRVILIGMIYIHGPPFSMAASKGQEYDLISAIHRLQVHRFM